MAVCSTQEKSASKMCANFGMVSHRFVFRKVATFRTCRMICKLWQRHKSCCLNTHSLHNLIPNMKESERFRTGRKGWVQSYFQYLLEIALPNVSPNDYNRQGLVCRWQLVKSLYQRDLKILDTKTKQSRCSAQSIGSAKTQNLGPITQTSRMATPCCIAVQTAKKDPSILTPRVYSHSLLRPPPLKVTFSCHSNHTVCRLLTA